MYTMYKVIKGKKLILYLQEKSFNVKLNINFG